jgi:hypothetical protein
VASDRTLWRRVLAVDLGLFNVAVFFFAYLPPSTLKVQEVLIMVGSAAAAVGLVAHALQRIHLPGEHWSYLITAMVGFLTFILYAHLSTAPYNVKIPYILLLISGIASALAAHVIDGGPEHD